LARLQYYYVDVLTNDNFFPPSPSPTVVATAVIINVTIGASLDLFQVAIKKLGSWCHGKSSVPRPPHKSSATAASR